MISPNRLPGDRALDMLAAVLTDVILKPSMAARFWGESLSVHTHAPLTFRRDVASEETLSCVQGA